ncbi:putative IMP dehydrogenase/GMP reductase, partial [Trifolium medium]|nr:putative IMP dehydrogenase/GMP reductase [Trifolium medium]
DQFLNDDADYAEPEAPQQPPHQPPQQLRQQPRQAATNQQNVEIEGYGGGPSDLSLLSQYQTRRAILIWDAEANDQERNLRCIASGKNVIDIEKPSRDERWFWDPLEASGLEPLTRTNFSVLDYE